MNSIGVSLIVFACVFSGSLLGFFLREVLPGHHLNADAKEAVKLGAGLVATLTALVLGLLISTAKGSFDATNTMVTQSGAKFLMMDGVLANYGPEARGVRVLLKNLLRNRIAKAWPEASAKLPEADLPRKTVKFEEIQKALRDLVPQNDLQRSLQAKALEISDEMSEIRWLLFEQLQTSLPSIFLGMLIFWSTVLFICFGLLAPRNGTLIVVFFVCAISVAGAIFLILEMGKPLSGTMKISSAPMVKTFGRLGK
ncbi:MAG TPA: hypothetical protein PLL75_04615 [Candidatus Omnitrophota bacterium]|nr:hypothetical protein [Candidatus Omnitrophota bacterium]HPS36994.1 hypothetical protein [Candidatus Omnitrophota bacterium]